ncbi:MAG: FAD-dependent oxidoreductase [Robiginitomaculum sp.]|nr:FAD-dependent oxidoreductase [Robiginitomaculum sp.]
MNKGTLIIGAGQGAAQAAISLRQLKYPDPITMIGEEPYLPYQRPPLSKGYLSGVVSENEIYLKPAEFWQKFNITIKINTIVRSINISEKQVLLDDGSFVGYENLIIATGTKPRQLNCPGADLLQVHSLRSLSDANQLKDTFSGGKNIVIIGGGYVGLECAASAIKKRMNVTLIEAQVRILARVAGQEVSGFFVEEHRRAGVDIRLSQQVIALHGDIDVEGVELSSGEILPADLVLVGIGAITNDELAKDAGLERDDGIVVDEFCKTSQDNIYAVGDVTRHPNSIYDTDIRLESVHNAIEQGKTAAFSIVGKAKPYSQVPWFWSDQYDLKLQTAGLSTNHDQVIVRGDPLERKFAVFYLYNKRLIACDAVNSPAEYMGARMLIAKQACPDAAMLADPLIAMKELLS